MTRPLSLVMILAVTVGMAPALHGCLFAGGQGQPVPGQAAAVIPNGTTLSLKAERATMVIGETQQLTAGIPAGVTPLYSSSSTGVATISARGIVTAVNVGTTTLKVAVSNISATVVMRVVTGLQPELLQVTTIDVQPGNQTVTRVGSQLVFSALARDSAAAPIPGLSIFWFSSNPNVATITPGGVLTIVGAGTTEVTASAGDKKSTPSVITVPGGSVNVNVDFGAG
ncbi:MAG: Ig-like domain-containing protein [Candidatus Sericytochromatia bacterium]|nr:Ig-like domain-containing protein [Candidatus Sericytochromatia bacterium]